MVLFRLAFTALPFTLLINPSNAFSPSLGTTHPHTRRTTSTTSNLQESPSSFQEDFVVKQKKVSSSNNNESAQATSVRVQGHLDHQREVFDEMSEFFNSDEATPPEVEPILDFLVKKALLQSIESRLEAKTEGEDGAQQSQPLRVLDVGCGTGALFSSYIKAANELGIELDIKGVDLSPKMIDLARVNSQKLVEGNGKHTIDCEMCDFVQRVMGVESCTPSLVGFDGGIVDGTEGFRGAFDVCVINACFGNFFDSNSVVTAASTSLKEGGVFVIGHPLGAQFVEKLREKSAATVPNGLPTKEGFEDMVQFQQLEVMDFQEEIDVEGNKSEMYYASAVKKAHRMLRDVLRLRGNVDEGFGRGGKKLGFPTANLPSSLFSGALINVPTGVYVGSAVIEGSSDEKKGRGVVHKAVVNVGYSPTFEGAENKEKIVEAHLIIDEGDIKGDFYGETMRLSLSGFLRPEMKFPAFSDLVKAITNDVQNAKHSLDIHPYATFAKTDPFLVNAEDDWVGSSGGDQEASYEFASTTKFLSEQA